MLSSALKIILEEEGFHFGLLASIALQIEVVHDRYIENSIMANFIIQYIRELFHHHKSWIRKLKVPREFQSKISLIFGDKISSISLTKLFEIETFL